MTAIILALLTQATCVKSNEPPRWYHLERKTVLSGLIAGPAATGVALYALCKTISPDSLTQLLGELETNKPIFFTKVATVFSVGSLASACVNTHVFKSTTPYAATKAAAINAFTLAAIPAVFFHEVPELSLLIAKNIIAFCLPSIALIGLYEKIKQHTNLKNLAEARRMEINGNETNSSITLDGSSDTSGSSKSH